jgi:uncharacterized SAM-binding protein YcdF (DUF218 family)
MGMDNRTDEQLAEVLWNYNHLGMPLEKSDAIIVLCSHDIQVADRGAELFHEGWAPLIVMSGGQGELTARMFERPEAELFAERAANLGVPGDRIWIENRSTNTGENVAFTRALLADKGREIQRVIAVQKPYMERRTYATFKKIWPGPELFVASPQTPFHEYKSAQVSREDMIHIIVGDTQRIKLYPEMGFQIEQEIPDNVWQAYEELLKRGYSKRLIRGRHGK